MILMDESPRFHGLSFTPNVLDLYYFTLKKSVHSSAEIPWTFNLAHGLSRSDGHRIRGPTGYGGPGVDSLPLQGLCGT
jgi:hypothetical protein